MMQPTVEVLNSEPGGFSCELALGQMKRGSTTRGITRDEFAPYRTNYMVKRQSSGSGVTISDGMVTSINLNKDRDTVLVSGKDWKHYLQRRIYPFDPEAYIQYDAEDASTWMYWPKQWPEFTDDDRPDIADVVRDILLSMRTGIPVDSKMTAATVPERPSQGDIIPGVPDIRWNITDEVGTIGSYKIYPGDSTTIYDHITKLSEMRDGFEWDILPESLEFKLWAPTKWSLDLPIYNFRATDEEFYGAITEFDWTNDGPDGTWLIGLGSAEKKAGMIWTDEDNVRVFGRLDLVYDYGEMQDTSLILQMLKDQNDLHPQKKLTLELLNPEFLTPNFYTGNRPRAVIGNTIRVTHDFAPLHRVDAYFQVNAIRWRIDSSTNEYVSLDLMMIYEPNTGQSGMGGESIH